MKMSLDRSIIEGSKNTYSRFAYVSLATLETILGSPSQALQYGLQARKFFASQSVVGNDPTQLDHWVNSAEISNSTEPSVEEHKNSEEKLVYIIFVPLFVKLIGSNLTTIEMLDELDKWNNEVLALKIELLLVDDWIKLVRYFKDLILFWKGDNDVDNKFTLFGDTSLFEILKTLLDSERPKVELNNAYILQVRVAISLPNYGSYAKHLFSGIGRFVHRYWLKIAQTRRFALHHPSLFLDELMSISPYDGADTLYEVLISAGRAVGVNLPDDVKVKMKKVKKMAKPWVES